MLASCRKKGRVVVVMPHGVLFRGGKEKEIREGMLKADVIEGIIGLPPQLFYGTPIPACVLVLNKSKDDKLKNKIFIINADKEYAEGKKQNNLRPEDVEKIDFVFANKIEEAKYSELVDVSTIADNDYTLNIRRYVDNTPEPEPEDVKAHLVGGVPITEIEQVQNSICKKFNYDGSQLFKDKDETYKLYNFSEKSNIKENVDKDKNVEKTLLDLGLHLSDWWEIAKKDFSKLAPELKEKKLIEDNMICEPMADYIAVGASGGDKIPEVRQELLDTIKEKFVPVGVLDKFQVAGVFVNWWDNIKYDLKIIMQNGWDAGLIPDEYLIEAFFTKEQTEIENLEIEQAEKEAALEEAIEEATTLLEYEADEDEKITATLIKKELKTQINYLLNEKLKPEEAKPFEEADKNIKYLEKAIKELKATLKEKQAELALKLIIKRYGTEDEKAGSNKLLKTTKADIEKLDKDIEKIISFFKADLKDTADYDKIKKSITALEKQLKKDKSNPEKLQSVLEAKKQFKEITKPYNIALKNQTIIQAKLDSLDNILEEIGGMISTEEAQKLILKKHFDIINNQLQRYLSAEKRALISAYENLWDKYAVSAQSIEEKRTETMTELNEFLTALKYMD